MRRLFGVAVMTAVAFVAACSDGPVAAPGARALVPGSGPSLETIVWNGNGTTAGACNKFQDDGSFDTPDGKQSWHFVLTQASDGGSTLTYSFDDGTAGSVGETKYTGGTYHFYVVTDIGAKLLSASATNGTEGSQLNVSHCESGTEQFTASIRTDIHDEATHNVITAVTGFQTVHDKAFVTGTGPAPTGTVSFVWFTTIDCTGSSVDAGTVNVVSGEAHPSNSFSIVQEGGYSFQATYNGDENYESVVAACEPLDATAITAAVLTASKDATATNDKTYDWDIEKTVDKTTVRQIGGSVTFNYTVTVNHDAGTISNVKVTGEITVSNPNPDPVDIDGVADAITDAADAKTDCVVTNGGAQTIQPGDTKFNYTCDFGSTLPPGPLSNLVTVTWSDQELAPSGAELLGGDAKFQVDDIAFTETTIDECIDVSDTIAGALGTVCVGDANPKAFNYSNAVPAPQSGCTEVDNTATFTTNDTGATGSSSKSVSVCGGVTGGLTMGFWQNKNGQTIIASFSGANCATLRNWLDDYKPFNETALTSMTICGTSPSLTGKTTTAPTGVVGYIYSIIKLASASGASMNAMLKAQMLATALDVYFSDPALGGNKINAPVPLGGVGVDLTYIKKGAIYENTSAAFGGASCKTVSQLLTDASNASNNGGSLWYAQVKATQELAKDTFDAINNAWAFSCV